MGSEKFLTQLCSDCCTSVKGRALLLRIGDVLRGHQLFVEIANAFFDGVFFARIAAQQVIGQVEPVLHHLAADAVGGLRERQRRGAGRLGRMFALYGHDIDEK